MLKKFKSLKRDWVDSGKVKFRNDDSPKGVIMCKNCYAFYYKNSWNFRKPDYLSEYDPEEETSVRFTQCGACLEQEDALFEQEANLIFGSEQMG